MPAWLLAIFISLGKKALVAALKALELKYPGIKPLVDKVIEFLDGGISAQALSEHLDKFEGLSPVAQSSHTKSL